MHASSFKSHCELKNFNKIVESLMISRTTVIKLVIEKDTISDYSSKTKLHSIGCCDDIKAMILEKSHTRNSSVDPRGNQQRNLLQLPMNFRFVTNFDNFLDFMQLFTIFGLYTTGSRLISNFC